MRIGFIGSGGMAKAHMKSLAALEGVELVAMCDVDPERAQEAADEYEGASYADFRTMLDKERLDAAYVCVPPFAHGEIELAACERGVHMFIEKPIAADMETAIRIDQAVNASGVIVSVGYQWRYSGATAYVKSVLEKEPRVLGAAGAWLGSLPGVPWWRVRAQSGGQHVEQTTHIFDLARYLIGSRATSVHGLAVSGSMTDVPNYDVDDMSFVNILFENGTIASIHSCCAMEGWGRVQLELFCRGLVATVAGSKVSINRKGVDEEVPALDDLERDEVFVGAVEAGDPSNILSPYSDAVETLRLMLAASESFETGRAVDVD